MKSYFAYIRVSTVKQGEYGSSLQEQKSAIEAYAARHALRISQWFEETETAAKQGRRQFTQLTNLLRKGKAAGVIIHKIDRSARNLKDWAGLGELIDAGVEVLFAHEGLDMQTRGGRLAADIQAVVAADFIRNLRDEVKKGLYGRLKQGYYPLPAPRGYVNRGKAKAKEICPISGPLVRQAFELYATGNYSLELLRHELFARGLYGRSGRPLAVEALSLLLHNPFYIGIMRIKTTGELFDGNHAPLIGKRLFDQVQVILEGRQYPRVQKHRFLFRRLLTCSQCGRTLSGERQKGSIYYRCHDRGCLGVSIGEEKVLKKVIADLQMLTLDDRDMGDIRDLFQHHIAIEDGRADERRSHVERDLSLLEQRITRLTDLLIDGAIDKATFDERKSDLILKRRGLHDRLESGTDVTYWKNVAERFELANTAYLGFQSGNDDEKRAMVNLVCSNLLIRSKEPVFSMHFPFDEIRDWSISTYGGQHHGALRTPRASEKDMQRKSQRVRVLFKRIACKESSTVFEVISGWDTSLKSLSPSQPGALAKNGSGIQTAGHESKNTPPAWRRYPRPLLPEPKPHRSRDSSRSA